MKKIILLLLTFSMVSTSVESQISNGTFIVEESFSFVYSNNSSDNISANFDSGIKETRFYNRTDIGYSFTDNFVAGVFIEYSKNKAESDNQVLTFNPSTGFTTTTNRSLDDRKTTTVSPGLYLRYNFKIAEKLYISPRLDLSHETNTTKRIQSLINFTNGGFTTSESETKIEWKSYNLSLSGLVMYTINTKLAVQVRVFNSGIKTRYNNSLFPANQQSKDTVINVRFNPVYWEYGLILLL